MKQLLAFLFLLFFLNVNAQENAETRKKEYNLAGNLAIEGYDPVAYFKQNQSSNQSQYPNGNSGKCNAHS